MQLHFQAQGHGTPLIILHGFLGSLDNWQTVSPRLSSRFTVFTVDLRNHGLSPHDETINYDVMSHDVFEFLEQHSLPSVHIAGHSMGGKVAMQFATDHTERVDKLIVVDMAPRTYEPLQRPVLDALRSIDLSVHKSFGEVDAALMTAIPETAMRRFLLKNLMRDRRTGLRWKINLEAISRNYDGLAKAIAPRRKFEKPACFIRAGRSNYIKDDDVRLIKDIFPAAVIVTVADAGHWVHVDAPEKFLKIVMDFLAGVR